MLAIVGFLVVHIALAMLVPSTLIAMVLGSTSDHRAQGTELSPDA
jgi:thiosulfate reductase cytochrome b subunit